MAMGPVQAQTPAPAKAASAAAAAAAQERSQDPAYSVFRWIKMHADTPRKPEPAKAPAAAPRPKTESTAAAPAAPSPRPATPEQRPAAEVAAPTAATAATAPPAVVPSAAPPVAAQAPAPAPAPAAAPAPVAAAQAETSEEPDGDLKIISQAQPEFPRELRTAIAHGKVVVSFTVQPDGTVAEPTVVSYTNRKLGKPAMDAVSKWVFEPVRSARTVQVEIAFNAQ